jgi:hypothetical protein
MSHQVVRLFLWAGKKVFYGAKVGDMNKQHYKRVKLPVWLLSLIAFALSCNSAVAMGNKVQTIPDTTAKIRLMESYGKLPLSFEANRLALNSHLNVKVLICLGFSSIASLIFSGLPVSGNSASGSRGTNWRVWAR